MAGDRKGRPCGRKRTISRNGGRGKPSPTTWPGRFPFCVGEPLGAPAGGLPKPRSHPHPPQCEHWGTFPLEAGRLGGRTMCAPTVGDRPVSLVRQSQAQEWNRNSCNFAKPGPSGPGGFRASLRFCAPEILQFLNTRPQQWGTGADSPCQGGCPKRQRGRVAVLWARRPVGRVPGALVSFPSQKELAARRRRHPPAKNHRSGAPGRGPGQPHLPLRGNSPSRALRGGRTLPPHPSGFAATFPPGGRLKKSGQRNSLPSPYHSNSKKFGDFL